MADVASAFSQLQVADAGVRDAVAGLVSELRSKASLSPSEHEQRLQSVTAQLASLLQTRHVVASLLTSGPAAPAPDISDLVNRLQSWSTASTSYMHKLSASADSLLTTIEQSSEGLSTHIHTPPPQDILALAHRIRLTSFDRLGVLPSQPPAPQMWHMRASALAAFNVKHAEASQQTHQAADSSKPSASVANGQTPAVKIPEMPPGWKPGDPIPGYEDSDSETSTGDDDMEVDQEQEAQENGGGAGAGGTGFDDWSLNPELGWEVAEEPLSDSDVDDAGADDDDDDD